MRNLTGNGVRSLAAFVLLTSVASAVDIYVATTGNDSWPGTSAQPKRTIKAGISAAAAGGTVHVRAGTYNESWINITSNVTVVSEDGLYAAKVNAGGSSSFRFENNCTNAEINGFECSSFINPNTSSQYDSLVRAWRCSNIRIRNMKIHGAPRDGDVVKIGGAGASTTDILLENCVIYDPAPRDGASGWQECVDIYPASGVTVRGCWIHHTPEVPGDTLIYAKGGSSNILWENNVFGPRHGDAYGNASTSAGGPSPNVFPSCSNFVARNNLFLDCNGDGAFVLLSTRNVEFYNNVIWNYTGTRTPIVFWTVGTGRNENFKFYNNIIQNSNGTEVFQDRGVWSGTTYIPAVFEHDYNIYYQVAGGGHVNINAEAHSLINVNPGLAAPASSVLATDTWATIVPRFLLTKTSPAVNAGLNLAGQGVTTDILGDSRPVGVAYDIGAHEYALPGDIDRDGAVNVFDIFVIAESWNTVEGDPTYNPAADLDDDGAVNVFDIFVLAENWNQSL